MQDTLIYFFFKLFFKNFILPQNLKLFTKHLFHIICFSIFDNNLNIPILSMGRESFWLIIVRVYTIRTLGLHSRLEFGLLITVVYLPSKKVWIHSSSSNYCFHTLNSFSELTSSKLKKKRLNRIETIDTISWEKKTWRPFVILFLVDQLLREYSKHGRGKKGRNEVTLHGNDFQHDRRYFSYSL